MKSFIIACLFIMVSVFAYAQTYTKSGNTYTASSSQQVKQPNTKTDYIWKDSKGNQYPIYISKNGSCYILKTSSKTGKEYKQYLGEEISKDICKQLNIEYRGKSKK